MRTPTLSKAEIVAALLAHDLQRRRIALRNLFENGNLRDQTIRYVRKNQGNRQDGEDVFQEAILLFDRKIREGQYRGEGELEAYFMGIVRWHWYNLRKRSLQGPIPLPEILPEQHSFQDPEQEYLQTEQKELMGKLLDQLNEKCRNLLKMYQLDFSMEEIAQVMGYANGGVAKKEAFLCRRRFRALLETQPELWQGIVKNTPQ